MTLLFASLTASAQNTVAEICLLVAVSIGLGIGGTAAWLDKKDAAFRPRLLETLGAAGGGAFVGIFAGIAAFLLVLGASALFGFGYGDDGPRDTPPLTREAFIHRADAICDKESNEFAIVGVLTGGFSYREAADFLDGYTKQLEALTPTPNQGRYSYRRAEWLLTRRERARMMRDAYGWEAASAADFRWAATAFREAIRRLATIEANAAASYGMKECSQPAAKPERRSPSTAHNGRFR